MLHLPGSTICVRIWLNLMGPLCTIDSLVGLTTPLPLRQEGTTFRHGGTVMTGGQLEFRLPIHLGWS
jgi:hypothetical protein